MAVILVFNSIDRTAASKRSSSASTRHTNNKNAKLTSELACNKQSEEDVDTVFGRISGYGNVSRPFPRDQNELNEYCK